MAQTNTNDNLEPGTPPPTKRVPNLDLKPQPLVLERKKQAHNVLDQRVSR